MTIVKWGFLGLLLSMILSGLAWTPAPSFQSGGSGAAVSANPGQGNTLDNDPCCDVGASCCEVKR